MKNITLGLATIEQKELMANLMEKYEYEFSQYTGNTMDESGLFGCYEFFETYLKDEKNFSYIICFDGKLAGFALITERDKANFSLEEFFITYNYRNQGVGQFAVNYLLEAHKGKWSLVYTPKNLPSKNFWPKVIGEFTGGKFEIYENHPKIVYDDGTLGTEMRFES